MIYDFDSYSTYDSANYIACHNGYCTAINCKRCPMHLVCTVLRRFPTTERQRLLVRKEEAKRYIAPVWSKDVHG